METESATTNNTEPTAKTAEGISNEQPIVETKSEKLTEFERVKRALIKAREEQKLEPASDARSPEAKAAAENTKKEVAKGKTDANVEAKSTVKGGDLSAEGENKDTTRDRGKAIPSRNLTKEEKAALDAAPPILQEAFKRREKELGNSANALNSKLGALEKELTQTKEKVAPILKEAETQTREINALLKRAGEATSLKPEEYVNKLIQADRKSRENPVEYIIKFAQGNGVDLKELIAGDPALAYDSDYYQQQRETARLQAELDYYKQQQQQQQQYQQQQQQSQTVEYVTNIASEYADGLTAEESEIFDTVSAQIFQKLEAQAQASGQVDYESIIRQSFEQALNYIPSAQQRKAEAQRQAASTRVSRASGASFSPRAGTGAVQAAPLSIQDRIRQNARAMGILGR